MFNSFVRTRRAVAVAAAVVCGAAVTFVAGQSLADETDARAIMAKVKANQEPADEHAEMTMALRRPGGKVRKRKLAIWTRRTDDERWLLVKFTSPASVRGTGFLAREPTDGEDERWLYLPSLRRTRRVPSSDRSDSFMGSELSYEDMESVEFADWKYRALSEKGETAVIEAVPRSKDVSSYSKIVYEIDTKRSLASRTIYYDRDGRKSKVLEGSGAEQHGGVWRYTKLVMRDLRRDRSTTLTYADIEVDQGLDSDLFSRHNLERGR